MIIPSLFLTSKIWGVPQWARGFDYMLFEEREKWGLYKRIIGTIALTIGISVKQ